MGYNKAVQGSAQDVTRTLYTDLTNISWSFEENVFDQVSLFLFGFPPHVWIFVQQLWEQKFYLLFLSVASLSHCNFYFFTFYFFWFFLSHRMKNVHRILLWWASGLLEAAIYYTHFNLRRVVCGGNYVEGEEGVCLVKMREGKYDSAKITGKEQVLKP